MKDNLYVGDYVECTLKYFHKNDPVSKTAIVIGKVKDLSSHEKLIEVIFNKSDIDKLNAATESTKQAEVRVERKEKKIEIAEQEVKKLRGIK